MKNANAKGMTLVEIIVAMAVFSVITSGFCLATKYCMDAQVRAFDRLTQTNQQTTNLETYAGATDKNASNVQGLNDPAHGVIDNRYVIKYTFYQHDDVSDTDIAKYTFENKNMYGYQSVYTDEDQVLKLGFFSAENTVKLDTNEYWITVTNLSQETNVFDVSGSSDDFTFFNIEHQYYTDLTSIPSRVKANGEDYRFGVHVEMPADLDSSVVIKPHEVDDEGNFSEDGTDHTLGLQGDWDADGDHFIDYYYFGESFGFFDHEKYVDAVTEFEAQKDNTGGITDFYTYLSTYCAANGGGV